MEEALNALPIIHSLPNQDGARQVPWQWDRVFTAVKRCPVCDRKFHPNVWFNPDGKPIRSQAEIEWNRQVCCSRDCAKKSIHQKCAEQKAKRKASMAPSPLPWTIRYQSVAKICQCCGAEFFPWFHNGRPMRESDWNRKKYCSISCLRKVENPMFQEKTRRKVQETLRRIHYRPTVIGGNGRAMPVPQYLLSEMLHAETEYSVTTTARQRQEGASNCYKLDVAIPFLRLGIQLDGVSHFTKKIRRTDKRIRKWLAELGWSVLHVSNSKARELCTTCKSKDTLLTMLTGSWFTTAI